MPLALLLLLLAGNTVRSEELRFEIALPESLSDWEQVEDERSAAHFRMLFPENSGAAHIQLWVSGLGDLDLESFISKWRPTMEQAAGEGAKGCEDKDTLAEVEWSRTTLRSEGVHLTWQYVLRGKLVYLLYVLRSGDAVDDEIIEEEITEILKTLRIREPPKGEAPNPNAPKPEAKPSPAREIHFEHWRVKLLKPEGLTNRDPAEFDESERANSVIARFDGHKKEEQSLCMIRTYAVSKKTSKWKPLDKVADLRLAEWEQRYPENQRLEPVRDKNKWKPPLHKKSIRLKLVSRLGTKKVTHWHFVDCRNGFQYHLEIFTTGTRGEQLWKPQIDAFLAGFKPLPK